MSKDPLVYVGHIVESIEEIESFLAGVTEADFISSSEKQSAVTWKLVVIGESVANLPEEFKDQYPAIPWAQIKAARNILVHEYFRLDVLEVWNIAINDLPRLKSQLKPLVA